ncbi:hypothetical protein BDP27DRAFT_1215964, partial [Rhodocollybia butyracea]
VNCIYYGQLDKILVLIIPDNEFWLEHCNTMKLLALITPCQTGGKDATKELVQYTETTAQIVTDLQNVFATVGHVKTQKQYGIIDRSVVSASTTFIE